MKVHYLMSIPCFLVLCGAPLIVTMMMKIESDKIFFYYGLSDSGELYNFINSQAHIARENVSVELAPPHRLVMGHESGTYTVLECFKEFELGRDQQGMMLTFNSPHVLEKAQETILQYMDRSWLIIYLTVIDGPNGSIPAQFTPKLVRQHLEELPKRIQVVLGFTNALDPLENSTMGYSQQLIRNMWDIFVDSTLIRRRTVAVQMELVHASHSDYLFSQSMSKLQDLLLHALPIVENSSLVDIVKMRRIIRSYGKSRILFDLSDEMREKLTREEDYQSLSKGNRWPEGWNFISLIATGAVSMTTRWINVLCG